VERLTLRKRKENSELERIIRFKRDEKPDNTRPFTREQRKKEQGVEKAEGISAPPVKRRSVVVEIPVKKKKN